MDFFESAWQLAWLPGETLYSLCSRQHVLSCYPRPTTTCQALFGHPRYGLAHDLPSRIEEFSVRQQQQLGSAEDIIRQHTLLSFYLPLASPNLAARSVSGMAGHGIGSLKFQLGLLTSRFRANHPLKACPVCMQEDREQWATSYWHVAHQLPGVWICDQHRVPLLQAAVKSTGVGRFQWYLPCEAGLAPSNAFQPHPHLLSLAVAAHQLWGLAAGTHFSPDLIAGVYRTALRERGLLKGNPHSQLHLKAIGPQYANHLEPLRQAYELLPLPGTPEVAAREVAQLTYHPRGGHHPLRHLALITWLFGTLDAFMAAYKDFKANETHPEHLQSEPQVQMSASRNDTRNKLVELIRQGQSITAASHQLGVDTGTGMAWAATAGIAARKRPSIVKGKARDLAIQALELGKPKAAVAATAGVSIQCVTRLLRTEVGLRDAWCRAQFNDGQRRVRRQWLQAMASHPQAGVKAIRMLEPAAYAWLYRNDKVWLREQAARMEHAANVGGTLVDWVSRDAELADKVARTGLEISRQQPGRRIKLWQLYQQLPDLKAKLAKLNRLPRTYEAIQQVLKGKRQLATAP